MTTTKSPVDDVRGRAARAAIVFGLVAPITYMVLRLYEIARGGHVDPSLILRSTHMGYVWRIAIATWWALTCALLTYGTRRRPLRAGQTAVLAAALASLILMLAFAYP